MNWLLIFSDECEKDADIITKFLAKKKVDMLSINLDEDLAQITSLAEEEGEEPGTSGIPEIMKRLESVTHCVLAIDEAHAEDPLILYVEGYIAGKGIPSFLTGYADTVFMQNGTLSVHETAKKLTESLDENFPLYIAEENRKLAKIKLFEDGIPFTPDCFSIHVAQEHLEICNLFLEAGMDINCRDSAGTPMLCIAARAGKKAMIEWLVGNGADIDAVSKDRGYSAVMDAVWKLSYDIVELLIRLGASLNFVSNDGQTALIVATGSSNEKICELLVSNNADPCVKDHMGMSAIDYARLFKKDNLVELYQKYAK